jgi:hypothetical protein
MSENWVKITLDSTFFVAGERVSGEVNCAVSEEVQILIKSFGDEEIKITQADGKSHSFSSKIYKLSEKIKDHPESSQSVFPFTFKVPQYAPASFNYEDLCSSGVKISASISYFIQVQLTSNEKVLAEDTQNFTILNKLSRVVIPAVNEYSLDLTSCFCVSRGSCKIMIKSFDQSHVKCYEDKKYQVSVSSPSNQVLQSVIAQLVVDLTFSLPGINDIKQRKVLTRLVPDLSEFHAKKNDGIFLFDFHIGGIERFGENPSSNLTGVLNCEYRLQVFAVYDVGCRSKRAEFELFLQINPVCGKEIVVCFPEGWQPEEHHLKSFLAQISDEIQGEE